MMAGSRGVDETELFSLLGNETRLAILEVMWEGFDGDRPGTEANGAIAYAELRRLAGYEGTGNFSYHLGSLEGSLVERRADGYVLSPLGSTVIHAIQTWTTVEDVIVDPTVIEDACPFCEGSVVASSERELLRVRCRACGGLSSGGVILDVPIERTMAADIRIDRLLDIGTQTHQQRIESNRHGICCVCHDRLDQRIKICTDHVPESDGICRGCGRRFTGELVIDCKSCGLTDVDSLVEYALVTPAVEAYFERCGRGPLSVGPWRYRLDGVHSVTETIVSDDPITVRYRFDRGTDPLVLRVVDDDGIEWGVSDPTA